MNAPAQPEVMIGLVVVFALAGFAVWRLFNWINRAPVRPDPWDAATEQAVQQPDALPVCHRCLTPAPPGQWFCETCGCAVGPYNNYMPYVDCFSEGEVFRNGVTARMPRSLLILGGYFLITGSGLMVVLVPIRLIADLSDLSGLIVILYVLGLAIYWRRLLKNLFRRPPQDKSPRASPAT
jgi:hypothetical protein